MGVEHIDMWAILGGLAVDFGITLAAGLFIGTGEALGMARRAFRDIRHREEELGRDLAEDEIDAIFGDPEHERRWQESLLRDRSFQAGVLVLELLSMILAGYFTARWADAAPLQNAALTGLLLVAGNWLLHDASVTPRWVFWSSSMLALPAALAGAWLCSGSPG